MNIFRKETERYTYMYINIYVQKKKTKIKNKTDWQARKKGIKFLTLSKMNNQKAHTEADKERGTVYRQSVTTFT